MNPHKTMLCGRQLLYRWDPLAVLLPLFLAQHFHELGDVAPPQATLRRGGVDHTQRN